MWLFSSLKDDREYEVLVANGYKQREMPLPDFARRKAFGDAQLGLDKWLRENAEKHGYNYESDGV